MVSCASTSIVVGTVLTVFIIPTLAACLHHDVQKTKVTMDD